MMPKQTREVDFTALYANLLAGIGAPRVIETPQLGRVESLLPGDIAAALALLRGEAGRAAGVSGAGVITIGYNRGLGPNGGCL